MADKAEDCYLAEQAQAIGGAMAIVEVVREGRERIIAPPNQLEREVAMGPAEMILEDRQERKRQKAERNRRRKEKIEQEVAEAIAETDRATDVLPLPDLENEHKKEFKELGRARTRRDVEEMLFAKLVAGGAPKPLPAAAPRLSEIGFSRLPLPLSLAPNLKRKRPRAIKIAQRFC
jgi:hypothetical protein